MNLLDTDKDKLVGFFDFLSPLLHVIPSELLTAFTQDQRFKQETFNDLRLCFDETKKRVDGQLVIDINLFKATLQEKGPAQSKILNRAFDQLLALIKVAPGQEKVQERDFFVGIARLEKRTLFTFVSQLYQQQERKLVGASQPSVQFVPDFALHGAVQTAISDPELQVDDAKRLLSQMQAKVSELEVRLTDYEDTAQSINPEQLPQAKAKGADLWKRFRRCLPSFIDVVLDSSATISDTSYLTMSDDLQKKVITDMNAEAEHNRKFKTRYEKIVDELAAANEEEQKKMTPNVVNVINKNLLKQRNDSKKIEKQQNRQIRSLKSQNKVYREFTDGKISKQDLNVIIEKSEREEQQMNQVKLRKIKVEKIRQQEEEFSGQSVVFEEKKSMKDLLAMFNKSEVDTSKGAPALTTKVTVIDEGNV